ncbi:Uu.00g020680.m01.CDS01 [Anthostomella pinea]|uniref:Uu.00g020680.m01.CDS01 n=1 Tax=Anthostomella pinea TaxID=933095 RepID=A0AAI8W059_9PEZI|nr:Uu.00g020680.m01.CDS01 [Anthostomella pinea]
MSRRFDPCGLAESEITSVQLRGDLPWVKRGQDSPRQAVKCDAVDRFMEKYVMYPCTEGSSPGFLEHLPSLFKEVNVEGRFALRWAVKAAAYADLSKSQDSEPLAQKAYQCYGMSLSAMGESLSTPGKVPDDFDLMTVVILDMFETFFVEGSASRGTHAQGMAQILRIRGHEQVHSPRGWSLFRLAHHRIQKQQLAFNLPPLVESGHWIDQLNEDLPFVRLEKSALRISQTCERARKLQQTLSGGSLPVAQFLDVVNELLELDRETVRWRQTPRWSYTTLNVVDLPAFESSPRSLTNTIQLHADVWMAYEWNYHRTARIIAHKHLLKALETVLTSSDLDVTAIDTLRVMSEQSTTAIHILADDILATVPQSLGDINHLGCMHDATSGPLRSRAIGGYLLLWPIKVIKGNLAHYALGFQCVTYGQLANAIIGVAQWLDTEIGRGEEERTPAIAYLRPNEFRDVFAFVGGIKAGYKLFLTSPRNSLVAYLDPLEKLKCTTIIIAGPTTPLLNEILEQRPMRLLRMGEMDHLINHPSLPYLYRQTTDTAHGAGAFVCHTSGTTGIPKPCIYTHEFILRVARTFSLEPPKGYTSLQSQLASNEHILLLPLIHPGGV